MIFNTIQHFVNTHNASFVGVRRADPQRRKVLQKVPQNSPFYLTAYKTLTAKVQCLLQYLDFYFTSLLHDVAKL